MLLVDGHDESTGLGVRNRSQLHQPLIGVVKYLSDPVTVRVERCAQAPRGFGRGQHDGEVGAAPTPVGHPFHVAFVRVKGHRPADAVE